MLEEVAPQEKAEGLGATEHDQQMIEKADQSIEEAVQEKAAPAPKDESRPEWLPEKYKTVDDFLEGHKNLEKKLGEREETEEPTQESEAESEENVPSAEAGALDTFYSEYEQNGALSEESYKALEDLNIPRDLVDNHIQGYEAMKREYSAKAADLVGGQDQLQAMGEWAVDNLTEGQLDAYNQQLALGGDSWELALRGLHDKYINSGDAPVQRIRSGEKTPVDAGIQPFSSQEELTAATRSKEYKSSPEFRALVMKRLEVSDNNTMGANIPNPYAQHG